MVVCVVTITSDKTLVPGTWCGRPRRATPHRMISLTELMLVTTHIIMSAATHVGQSLSTSVVTLYAKFNQHVGSHNTAGSGYQLTAMLN